MSADNKNHITLLRNKFAGRDVVVCGTGSSLSGFDWTQLNDCTTIALNDAVKVPGFEPDIHLFSDSNLFFVPKRGKVISGGYDQFRYHEKTKVVCQKHTRTNFLNSKFQPDSVKERVYQFNLMPVLNNVTTANDELYIHRTVATGGILLAWKMGARRIFLFGVDGYKRVNKDGTDVYYYDGRSKGKEKRKQRSKALDDFTMVIQDRHDAWIKQMREVQEFLRTKQKNPYPGPWPEKGIYSMSMLSPIDAWEKVPLDQCLLQLKK